MVGLECGEDFFGMEETYNVYGLQGKKTGDKERLKIREKKREVIMGMICWRIWKEMGSSIHVEVLAMASSRATSLSETGVKEEKMRGNVTGFGV